MNCSSPLRRGGLLLLLISVPLTTTTRTVADLAVAVAVGIAATAITVAVVVASADEHGVLRAAGQVASDGGASGEGEGGGGVSAEVAARVEFLKFVGVIVVAVIRREEITNCGVSDAGSEWRVHCWSAIMAAAVAADDGTP